MRTREPWIWTGGVAVITGGGGLLGRGLALGFARAGMAVVVSDLDLGSAKAVAAEITALGQRAVAVAADVADPSSIAALADRAWAEFGTVTLLCNNAGIALLRPYEELTLADWHRVLEINLMGVIHGVHAFLPRMIEQSGPRHILNTASMSGVGLAELRQLNAPYVTTKFAVVGLSETLAPILANHGIGISVLCPGMTVPDPAQPPVFAMPSAEWYKDNLLSPFEVAQEAIRGIEQNRLYIFPHHAGLGEVEQRHERILRAFHHLREPLLPPKT